MENIAAIMFVLSSCLVFTCSAHYGGLRYIPHVGNIAIGRPIMSSSTCGLENQEQYCSPEPIGTCGICDNSVNWLAHPSYLMTDTGDSVHSPYDRTWWQSETNVSYVVINNDFGAIFFFTHVIVSFKSWRPAAMIIEKSLDYGATYKPIQYYSTDCEGDFGLPDESDGTMSSSVSCTSKYSQPSAGEVVYQTSTSTAQPDLSDSAYLDNITLTNLRMRLLRFHRLPGNDPSDPQTAVRQFYAIYNIDVFGWCFCNGHETTCDFSEEEANASNMVPSVCRCANNTAGEQCENCLPDFNNAPWRSGFDPLFTGCQECNCYNHSNTCYYDSTIKEGICEDCQHNTAGANCDKCSPGHTRNRNVSMSHPNTCEECQCNPAGILTNTTCSSENGTCQCLPNVEGEQCQRCKSGFYNLSAANPQGCQACSCPSCELYTGRCPCQPSNNTCCPFDQYHNGTTCVSCDCHVMGSHGVCHEDGRCVCKPGVGGVKCDQCLDGYHSLSDEGCIPCGCDPGGSNDPSTCDRDTGKCNCLPKVEGNKCNRCPAGTVGPVRDAAIHCIPCYCNGYSSQCESEPGWYWAESLTEFKNESSIQEWRANAEISFNNGLVVKAVDSAQSLRLYFPTSYLQDKRTAYSLYLSFTITLPYHHSNSMYLEFIGKPGRLRRRLRKILDTSGINQKVAMTAEGFTEELFFSKTATEDDVRMVLSNLTSMRIVVTFGSDVSMDNRYFNLTYVKLPYATKNHTHSNVITPLQSAPVGENCICPVERSGERCHYCSEMYTQDPSYGGEFSVCVRCYCYGLTNMCDPVSSICINCANNSAGTHCQNCAEGYYQNRTTFQCLPCQCPGGSGSQNQFAKTCHLDNSGQHVICDCRNGFIGNQCEQCDSGFHGDPTYENGTCRMCTCNNNSASGINTCDMITGQCLCADGYVGENCEYCQLGYYGNALAHDCQSCSCYLNGTVSNTYCHLTTGQCVCKDNVEGKQCDQCSHGYWNIDSGEGCVDCDCSSIGSNSSICNKFTGQCNCRESYDGRRCAQCKDGYWNRGDGTCIACGCPLDSSMSPVCNKSTGICSCREGVIGDKCNRCLATGTTGILPFCERCDECSTQWTEPINLLGKNVSHYVAMVTSLNVTNVSYTEHPNGRALIQPLLDLLMEIETLLNASGTEQLLRDVQDTHIDITNFIDVIRNALLRASTIEQGLQITNRTANTQLMQLHQIISDLQTLLILLRNITRDADIIGPVDFSDYVNRINAAVNSSDESKEAVDFIVIPSLSESEDKLAIFATKEMQFLNISEEVVQLLSTLRNYTRYYQNLLIEADQKLCGKVIPAMSDSLCSCYSNNDRCKGDCGGIGCKTCGGDGTCNGSVSDVMRSANLSSEALDWAKEFQKALQSEIATLQEANMTSLIAKLNAGEAQLLAERVRKNITELIQSIHSFTVDVWRVFNSSLPNITIIEQLIKETESFQLSRTPEEVLELLREINETIMKFPTLEIGSDLEARAQRALNVSIAATKTATTILSNARRLASELRALQLNITMANSQLNQTQLDADNTESVITKARGLLDSAEDIINNLSKRVRTLNDSLFQTKSLFERNRQKLEVVKNLTNQTSKEILQIEQKSNESQLKLLNLANTTAEKQVVANEGLKNAQILKERMIELRKRAHQQLLHARNLQNKRSCIVTQQEYIRDDIKRVAAELESLHNRIEAEVARNTICMKTTQTS